MEHHAPHAKAAFEGYYNKFDLPSGAHLVIVICKVHKAKIRPNLVSLTYVPEDASKIYQKEIFLETLELRRPDKEDHYFILDMPGIGFVRWDRESLTEYRLECDHFSFQATATSRVPWSADSDTPEGMLVNLPLPLHWHVHSLASLCDFQMAIPGCNLPLPDTSGQAYVHQEKNWAFSFPLAHMWVQCRDGARSFCCAGGQILGMEAFLLGYRSKDLNLDFRPPFAVRFAGISPFMSYLSDWESRTFELNVQTFRRKISVKASAPKGSFFSLSPPFPEGHRENYLGQSFQANVEIRIYESGWLGSWRLIREDQFDGASLEFGGAYYPPAGSKQKFN